MNAAMIEELLQAFANELNLNDSLGTMQKLDLMTDLSNAIYAAKEKLGA